ncbi:hypothetical protein [Serratia fonticola]
MKDVQYNAPAVMGRFLWKKFLNTHIEFFVVAVILLHRVERLLTIRIPHAMHSSEGYCLAFQPLDAVYVRNRPPAPVWQMDIAEMLSHFWQVAL